MIRIYKKEMPHMLAVTFKRGKQGVMDFLKKSTTIIQPEFSVRGAGTPLYQEFHEKCAFCESKTKSVEPLKYHHYRPSYNATSEDGSISKKHYIWLMYEWDNLFLVCNTCAKNKANNFPLLGGAERCSIKEFEPEKNLFTREELLKEEYPLIFDPCHYDPEDWFYYTKDGFIDSLKVKDEFGMDRSEYTIKCLDLNRIQLVEARKEKINWITKLMEKAQEGFELSAYGNQKEAQTLNRIMNGGTEEYSGVCRFFIKLRIASDSRFSNWVIQQRVVSKERALKIRNFFESNSILKAKNLKKDEVILRSTSLGQFRINEIKIKGFRAIKEELSLRFPNTSPTKENWLVLIGDNGSGKSTILQAVYACLSNDWFGLTPDDFEDDGIIHIETEDGHMSLKKSEVTGDLVAVKIVDNTPILGYGAIRMSLSEYNNSGIDPSKIQGSNLVNPLKPLINTSQWIKERVLSGDFDKNTVKESLLKLVDRDNTFDIKLIKDTPHIVNNLDPNQKYEYHYLSTGFKQLLTIACDIIDSLNVKYNDIQSARGIVLIDELENHLHPKWKTRIVGQLREIFPLVQFIVATHEPLCINSLEEGEVILTKRSKEGKIKVHELEVPIGTKSSEVLTGEWFGLTSTLDSDTLELMENHRRMMYSKELKNEDYDQEKLAKIESEISSRLSNSSDRTLFGIFKEEYKKMLASSVESLDFESQSFRDVLRAKLKSKLDS